MSFRGRIDVLFVLVTAMALLPSAASAHRLDEYLQATRISIERDRISAEMSLTPGAAVADTVIADIDADHNGVVSEAEGRAYAGRFVNGVSLDIDGQRLPLTLDAQTIPALDDMRRGEGVIRMRATSALSAPAAGRHHLRFANSYRSDISAYLVNALLPADEGIRITGQSRDMWQREFDLEYSISPPERRLEMAAFWPPLFGVALASVALIAFRRLPKVRSFYR